MVYDAGSLPATSSKNEFKWRDAGTALLLIRASGEIRHAGVLEEKRLLADDVGHADCLLAIRRGRCQPDVLRVDDLAEARSALQ